MILKLFLLQSSYYRVHLVLFYFSLLSRTEPVLGPWEQIRSQERSCDWRLWSSGTTDGNSIWIKCMSILPDPRASLVRLLIVFRLDFLRIFRPVVSIHLFAHDIILFVPFFFTSLLLPFHTDVYHYSFAFISSYHWLSLSSQ